MKISDLDDFKGREWGLAAVLAGFDELEEEMRADKLLEKAREVEDDMGLCFVFEGSLTP